MTDRIDAAVERYRRNRRRLVDALLEHSGDQSPPEWATSVRIVPPPLDQGFYPTTARFGYGARIQTGGGVRMGVLAVCDRRTGDTAQAVYATSADALRAVRATLDGDQAHTEGGLRIVPPQAAVGCATPLHGHQGGG